MKTIREVLEEFLRKHYLLGLTSCVNIPYEDEALAEIEGMVVPTEQDIEKICKQYIFDAYDGHHEVKAGLSVAIHAMLKERIKC